MNDNGCGRDCDCESEELHQAYADESLRAFLADPGRPPAGWSAERIARAEAGMAMARSRS